MDETPEKRSEEVAQESPPAVRVRNKLGWMRYFAAQAADFCEVHDEQDVSGKTAPVARDSEEYVLRRYRAIIRRAKQTGDLGSEIRAVDKLCKIQGIGAVESTKNLERVPMEKLIRQIDAGIRLLGPFMVDVLDARVFKPGVDAIWDHKVSRDDAPQYMVECLRLAPFLQTKTGAPSKNPQRSANLPKRGDKLKEYWQRKKAEKEAKNAIQGVSITAT